MNKQNSNDEANNTQAQIRHIKRRKEIEAAAEFFDEMFDCLPHGIYPEDKYK